MQRMKTLLLSVLLLMIGFIMGHWIDIWTKPNSLESRTYMAARNAKMDRGRREYCSHKEDNETRELPAKVSNSNEKDVTERTSNELHKSSVDSLILGNPYEIATEGEHFDSGRT